MKLALGLFEHDVSEVLKVFITSDIWVGRVEGSKKNLTLGLGFLKRYMSDFLEMFFPNRPKRILLRIKISGFPFQDCRRWSSSKLA